MTDPEQGLVVEGETLEVDLAEIMHSMNLDEAHVMYELSGVVQEDFMPAHPNAPQEEKDARDAEVEAILKKPRFKLAVATIGYMRAHPDASLEDARKTVGKANVLGLTLAMFGEDEPDPPEENSQTPPENETPSRTLSGPSGSGSPSTNGSDDQANDQTRTGTTPSDTSSPVSDSRPEVLSR